MKKYLILGAVFLLLGCNASGPQKALDNMANALEENKPSVFIGQIDMQAYTANTMRSRIAGNDIAGILNSVTQSLGLGDLNSVTQSLGLGDLESWLNSIVDAKAKLAEQFTQGVSTGELMADCRTATTADCPWVPDSLRGAEVIQINNEAAIAKVTTPARITSWIALRKIGDKWLVVGKAVLEKTAREFALANQDPASKSSQERLPSHAPAKI